MKSSDAHVKNLATLLKKIGEVEPPEFPDADDPIAVLILSTLMWESTTEKAIAAYARLRAAVVDDNDLRVTMPHEIAEIIGTRYPKSAERSERLRATLRDVYLREHAINLDSLAGKGKRDVKKYVESLNGISPYVSARVQLLCFDVHGVPVDEQLRSRLADYGAVEPDADEVEVAGWLARHVRASDGLKTHYALQAWSDGDVVVTGGRGGKKKRSRRKTANKSAGARSA